MLCDSTSLYSGVRVSPTGFSQVSKTVGSGVIVSEIDMSLSTGVLTATLNSVEFPTRVHNQPGGGNLGNYPNYIFGRSGSLFPFAGYIFEFGVYAGDIGINARRALTYYLRNKWAF